MSGGERGATAREPSIRRGADEAETRALWALFLAGPTIWFTHFMVVYLLAEVLCKPLRELEMRLLGLPLVSFLTVVATVLAAGATLWLAKRSGDRWRGEVRESPQERPSAYSGMGRSGMLALGGVLLGVLFFIAVLFTGAPALFLSPC